MTFLSVSSVFVSAFLAWLAYYVYEHIVTRKRSNMHLLAYQVHGFFNFSAPLLSCGSRIDVLPIVLPTLALGS